MFSARFWNRLGACLGQTGTPRGIKNVCKIVRKSRQVLDENQVLLLTQQVLAPRQQLTGKVVQLLGAPSPKNNCKLCGEQVLVWSAAAGPPRGGALGPKRCARGSQTLHQNKYLFLTLKCGPKWAAGRVGFGPIRYASVPRWLLLAPRSFRFGSASIRGGFGPRRLRSAAAPRWIPFASLQVRFRNQEEPKQNGTNTKADRRGTEWKPKRTEAEPNGHQRGAGQSRLGAERRRVRTERKPTGTDAEPNGNHMGRSRTV